MQSVQLYTRNETPAFIIALLLDRTIRQSEDAAFDYDAVMRVKPLDTVRRIDAMLGELRDITDAEAKSLHVERGEVSAFTLTLDTEMSQDDLTVRIFDQFLPTPVYFPNTIERYSGMVFHFEFLT